MKETDHIILANTITKLPATAAGAVVISGSHGGIYPGYLACKAGLRAIILSDAGIGKDNAGIASLAYCQNYALAAATIAHTSARIGDSEDMLKRGIISHANEIAQQCGCHVGMRCAEAAQALTSSPLSNNRGQPYNEGRHLISTADQARRIICIDSASLVHADDKDQIVITGSHGGLIGNNPSMALQVDAFAAFYNDAGIGIDNAGITRLSALEKRGIAAACVNANSARIGDARSTYYDGTISVANQIASNFGAKAGMSLCDFITLLQQQPYHLT